MFRRRDRRPLSASECKTHAGWRGAIAMSERGLPSVLQPVEQRWAYWRNAVARGHCGWLGVRLCCLRPSQAWRTVPAHAQRTDPRSNSLYTTCPPCEWLALAPVWHHANASHTRTGTTRTAKSALHSSDLVLPWSYSCMQIPRTRQAKFNHTCHGVWELVCGRRGQRVGYRPVRYTLAVLPPNDVVSVSLSLARATCVYPHV